MHFSMPIPRLVVPSLTPNLSPRSNHTPDVRIWRGIQPPAFPELKCPSHELAVLRSHPHSAARIVFCSSAAIVIGPTPPGTGVIAEHFGATAS